MSNLRQKTAEHLALVGRIREMFPDETDADLADTIEGESDLKAAIGATLRAAREIEALRDGLDGYITSLRDRSMLLAARSERLRGAALNAATESGYTKLTEKDFTASLVQGKPKVIITGEKDVPETFCRVRLEPNKTAIAEAMSSGYQPDWAQWSNPAPHWMIRTK